MEVQSAPEDHMRLLICLALGAAMLSSAGCFLGSPPDEPGGA